MPVTYVGVRHHSPACARHVAATIERLRPRHVLIEGPADMNDRLDELQLGHELPIAIFSSYRDAERVRASWAPLCEYSPEWVALTLGRRVGAQVRFIDLPAWDERFDATENRYADAEDRYAEVIAALCERFHADNVDTLWDHLFEAADPEGIGERLAAYFDLLRADEPGDPSDAARERYMAGWIAAAALDAGEEQVVVVTGGFHRRALMRLAAEDPPATTGWPDVPRPHDDAVSASYLVPFSFRRLDAFHGYQSGMPSPGYYQRVWEAGVAAAAEQLIEDVATRLRQRRQPVSTAHLIAARTMGAGLAQLRGNPHPARADVLDGLATTLVTQVLDAPLPWTRRSVLARSTDPVVVEMVAALSGDREGRLADGTPLPPLWHDVVRELTRLGLGDEAELALALLEDSARERSVVLNRLRILRVTDFERLAGPAAGTDTVFEEHWAVHRTEWRQPSVIEAAGYGPTLRDAAAAALAERIATATTIAGVAAALFDCALCGIDDLSADVLADLGERVRAETDLGDLGAVLAVTVGLWRHDRLLGLSGSTALAVVIEEALPRLLWLVEGVRGGTGPADLRRIDAVVAARDALLHGPHPTASADLPVTTESSLAVFERVWRAPDAPADLRGAALGLCWSLGRPPADAAHTVRGAARPETLGDWLAGLFALAREEVRADAAVTAVLDEVLTRMSAQDFLVALPALRQAFEFFPPRERAEIAAALLALRGRHDSSATLLRPSSVAPELVAEAAALEDRVDVLLTRAGLLREPG